ncbi:MAG: HNH endonuclease [Thermoplasmata archaeon]
MIDNQNETKWRKEIIKIINSIDKVEFNLQDVYSYEKNLSDLFPNNRHIKAKIRQQLQILRDEGVLEFIDNRGRFRKLFVTPEEQQYLTEIKTQIESRNFRVEDTWVIMKKRVAIGYFRKQVLSNFEYRCCICHFDLEQLLEAAHIIPWNTDPDNRINPGNGLSMCRIHHGAFDLKIIRIAPDLTISVSDEIRKSENDAVKKFILEYDGNKILKPIKYKVLLN